MMFCLLKSGVETEIRFIQFFSILISKRFFKKSPGQYRDCKSIVIFMQTFLNVWINSVISQWNGANVSTNFHDCDELDKKSWINRKDFLGADTMHSLFQLCDGLGSACFHWQRKRTSRQGTQSFYHKGILRLEQTMDSHAPRCKMAPNSFFYQHFFLPRTALNDLCIICKSKYVCANLYWLVSEIFHF
jgi:hypothetical protein